MHARSLLLAAVCTLLIFGSQAHAQIAVPAAPTGLSAASVTHDTITLSWDDPSDNSITDYRVLRRSRDGEEYGDGRGAAEFVSIVDDTGSSATTYTDNTVNAGTRYVYRVKAINPAGTSGQSSYLNVETPAAPTSPSPPAAPTSLAVSSATHDSASLTWDDPGDSTIESYQVLRRSLDGDEYGDGEGDAELVVIVDDIGSSDTTYTDTSVTARTRYVYRVKARNPQGLSGVSSNINTETLDAPPDTPQWPVQGSRPNVVLILADDLGWGDIQSNNPDSAMTTPRIDGIAAAGANFSDAHSPSSMCSPTRYGLLTGRYAWRTWLSEGVLGGHDRPMIGPGRATLGTLLQGHGYRTAAVGKWHLGMDFARLSNIEAVTPLNGGIDLESDIEDGPLDHGFDEFFGTSANLSWEPHVYIHDRRFTGNPERRGQPASGFYGYSEVLDRLTKEAVAFIERSAPNEAPFFLYLPLHTPHVPHVPNAQFAGLTSLGKYADVVAQMDWTVGQVLDVLERAGVRDDTLVIFSSDNGSFMRGVPIPNHAGERHQTNGYWAGGKGQIHEGGHRVPLLMQWPSGLEAGSNVAATVSLTDVYATLAEILGEEPGPGVGIDSVSLMSLLRGEAGSRSAPVVHHSRSGMFALRDGRWKLVFGNGNGGVHGGRNGQPFGQPWRLFDLEQDPRETRSVAGDHPEVMARMTASLERIRSAEDAALSSDATLKSLNLAGVDIGPFYSDVLSYTAGVRPGATIVEVTAIPTATDSRVRITDTNGSTVGGRRQLRLAESATTITITITVTSPDGSATAKYTVTVGHRFEIITGTPQVGQTLTADTSGIDDEDGLDNATFSYQWIRDNGSADSEIAGATSATYTLTTEDQGKAILVRVSFTDDGGKDEKRTSVATATVGHAAGELTAARDSNIFPVVSGYSVFRDLGTLSPDGWEIDGTHYTVKFLAHAGESLVLGLDEQLPTDFTLHVGDSTYRGSESKVPPSLEGVEGFWWPSATPDWSEDEPVRVKLAIHREVPLGERPRAPVTGNFRNIPPEHDGSGDFSFRIYFSEGVATTVDTMQGQVLAVAGGVVSSVEAVGDEGRIWAVSVTPGSRDTITVEIEPGLDCHLAGAVCAADGRRLFNRMDLRVPMRPNNPATGAPAIGGTAWAWVGDTLTADTSGISDADGMSGTTLSYQWLFSDGGVDSEVEGANQSTYSVSDAVRGKTIKVRVSFADDVGYAESLTSAGMTVFVSERQDRPYQLQAAAAAGAITLTWQDPNTHSSYGWYQILRHRPELGETEPLIHARYASITDRTFIDSTVEPGVQYVYAVKAVKDPFGHLGPASGPVAVRMPPAEGANSPATGQPAISGTAEVGETLTADASGIADDDGLSNASFSYQWVSNDGSADTNIQDATAAAYTLVEADEGKAIKIRVNVTDDAGYEETLSSAATAMVRHPADALVWEGELTAGQDTGILPVMSGYSGAGSPGGTLSSNTFVVDGTTHTVQFLVHASGSLWLEMDRELPEDFTLRVGDSAYRGSESMVPYTISVGAYWWPSATPDWTIGDPVQVSLAVHPDVPLGTRQKAPVTGHFRNVPSEHGGDEDFSFNIHFTEVVSTTAGALRNHVLAVTGGVVSSVEAVEHSDRVWAVSVTPDSTDTVTIEIEADLDCALSGAVCTSDGRRLFNRMELEVAGPPLTVDGPGPGPKNNPATGAPAIGGAKAVGETLTADTSGIADADGLQNATFSHQWVRGDGVTDTDIPGETGPAYEVAPSDAGKTIRVRVSFTDDAGNDETTTSAATAAVSATVPGTPRSLEVETAGTGELAVTWQPPESHGGSEVTGYRVQWKLATGSWDTPGDVSSATATGTSHTIGSLSLDTEYAVRVIATNSAGDGPPSAERTETARARASEQQDSTPNTAATGAPTINGKAQAGETLTADTSDIADENGLDNASFNYQWESYDGNADTDIPGAAGSTYTLVPADEGRAFRVRVSFTDDDGHRESLTSALARSERPYALSASASDGAVALTWKLPVGWPYSSTFQILRNRPELGEAEPLVLVKYLQAPGNAHTDTDVAAGVLYVYRVKGVDPFGYIGEASQPVEIRAEAAPAENNPASGAPTISGTAQVGETLTADTSGIADEDGLDNAAFSYQWLADDAEIEDATASTYALAAADEGKVIKVRVSFTDDADNDESLTSDATATVSAAPAANTPATGAPTISGTVRVGETLAASTSGISDADGLTGVSYTYQWVRNDGNSDSDIQGATGSTYTLGTADEGKTIKVRATFTDDANNEETLTSQATEAVAAPPPLTVSVTTAAPATHDGAAEFTFEIRFSEELHADFSYRTLRDHAFTVTGGAVKKAQRLQTDPESNIPWRITVQPDGNGDVTVALPVTTDCGDQEAICTGDGRKLSNGLEFTVGGLGQ